MDFGNSLPITTTGSHNVSFIGQLMVAIPRKIADDGKAVSCADDLVPLGVVLYRLANWYENSAGVQSFPPIGVLSDEEIKRLETTPLIIAEVRDFFICLFFFFFFFFFLVVLHDENSSLRNIDSTSNNV